MRTIVWKSQCGVVSLHIFGVLPVDLFVPGFDAKNLPAMEFKANNICSHFARNNTSHLQVTSFCYRFIPIDIF